MFTRFCAGQNIRSLILGKIPSPIIQRFQPIFKKVFNGDSRGTLLSDIFALEDTDQIQFSNLTRKTSLDVATCKLLEVKLQQMGLSWAPSALRAARSESVLVQTNITARVKYSVDTTAYGDSQVVFGDYPSGNWFAGRISMMFAWPKSSQTSTDQERTAFLLLRALKPLTEAEASQDWYRTYPDGGRLFSAEYEADSVLIHIEEVIAHFAGTVHPSGDGTPRWLHVLPLDR